MPSAAKVWFITGSSRGLGRVWAEAALERGDRVAASARDTDALAPLVERHGEAVLPLRLDVTDKSAVDAAIATAHERFERLDVVINNAGYGLFGMVEEVDEQQARAQIETNLFGPLWVTQAALPYLRAQGAGHIVQVSSLGGVHAFPSLGLYHASKFALEAFSQSLAAEVAEFGIKVPIVEPGAYATEWAGPSAVRAEGLAAYADFQRRLDEHFEQLFNSIGDPAAAGPALLELVDADDPPLRVFFGAGPLDLVRAEYAGRLATWERWDPLSRRAHGTLGEAAA